MTDDDFRPIDTAPRDGTLIEIHDPDSGTFPMRWDAQFRNGFFPNVTGMWVSPSGDLTWNEAGGYGPTKWRPYKPGRYLH